MPPGASASSTIGTSFPLGAKRVAASSRSGGRSKGFPTENRSQLQREILCTARTRRDMHDRALVEGDLCSYARGRTEAVDAETAAGRQPGAPQGPVADDAGA